MKKILVGLALALIAATPVYAYTTKKGDTPWKLWGSNWKTEITQCGVTDPKKLPIGCEVSSEPTLGVGYNPVTAYQSRLSQYVSASAATIPVISTKDSSGVQIDLTKISSASTVKVYMNIDAGTTNQEPIVCTGLTATSWTGCTRGLSFQGSSETASTTLQKAHNAGTPIIITNIGQFYNQYVSTDGTQTINDLKTFTTFPRFNTSTQLPTVNGEFATKYYVDTVGAGGFTSVNVSTTRGLSVDGSSPEKVGINASSTTGMAFDSSGALYQKTQSATGVESDSDGIKINTSTLVGLIATSTPTASMIPIANASGTIANGFLNASTTAVSSSLPISNNTDATISNTWLPALSSASGVYASSSIVNANYDVTYDCGFVPTIIQLNFSLKGINNQAGPVYGYTSGQSFWNGTTVKHTQYYQQEATALTTFSPAYDASTPEAGDLNNNLIRTRLSVNSVSGTNVTVRADTAMQGSPAAAATQSFGIICYK